MSVNLYGVVNGIRAFVPHLVAQGSGHVVNIASMAGVSVTTLQAPYIASKFAVAGVSEGLRAELDIVAPNVGVTVAFPGVMITNIFTSDRNRPASLPGKPYELSDDEMAEVGRWADEISGPGMPAAEAAEIIVRAVEAGALHVAAQRQGHRGARPVRLNHRRPRSELSSPSRVHELLVLVEQRLESFAPCGSAIVKRVSGGPSRRSGCARRRNADRRPRRRGEPGPQRVTGQATRALLRAGARALLDGGGRQVVVQRHDLPDVGLEPAGVDAPLAVAA